MKILTRPLALFIALFLSLSVLMSIFSSLSFSIQSNHSADKYNGVYWLDFPASISQTSSELAVIDSLGADKLILSNFRAHGYILKQGVDFANTASSTVFNLTKPVQDFSLLHAKFSRGEISNVRTPFLFIMTVVIGLSTLITSIYMATSFILNNQLLTREIEFEYRSERISAWWSHLSKNWIIYCLVIFIASRLCFAIDFKILTFYYHGIRFPAAMMQWDSVWYQNIVTNGYLHASPELSQQANWAFFPAFPLVAKLLVGNGAGFLSSAILFNQIINFLTIFVVYDYLKISTNKNIANWGTLLFAFSPANVYFMSPYTESLFVFLSLIVVNLLSREKFFYAAAFCGLLVTVRVVGAVMPVVLLFAYVMHHFIQNKRKFELAFVMKLLLLALVSFSGLIAYMLYLKNITGDYLAFYHVQKAWGKTGISGWSNPVFALFRLLTNGNLIDLLFFWLSLWITWLLYKYKRYNDLLFFALCCLLPIITQTLASYARYTLGIYGFYVALAIFADQRKIYNGIFSGLFILAMFVYLFIWVSGVTGIQ